MIIDIQKKENEFNVKSNLTSELAIKDIDTTSRIVTGFYSSSNFFDDACDVVLPGAFKRTIKERGPNSSAVAKIKHALNHDITQLPGQIITLEEKELSGIHGLYFETKMTDTTLGNDTLKNYLAKVYDNHSIGYGIVDYEFIERVNEKKWEKAVSALINPKATEGKSCMWLLKELKLWEGSTVSFGCNELTPFLGMKSKDPKIFKLQVMNKIMAMETVLKTGTQSDDMMETISIHTMQLKQIFSDLLDKIPAEKKEEKAAFNVADFYQNFTLGK